MKKLSIIVLFIALFAVGCEKWDHKIAAVEDRLELLEGTTIPNIEQQIVNINASIDDLKAVDEALQGLIDNLEAKAEDLQAQLDANAAADAATKAALESEIANLKALIAALQAKDVELDQKIADLQKYVDDEISATEDWANQTFSTLEQYADMQQEDDTDDFDEHAQQIRSLSAPGHVEDDAEDIERQQGNDGFADSAGDDFAEIVADSAQRVTPAVGHAKPQHEGEDERGHHPHER